MRLQSWVLVMSLTLLSACATAQTGKLEIPNYSHLALKAHESSNINLSGMLLRFASHLSRDMETKQLLAAIDGIQVRSYEFTSDNAYSHEDVDSVRQQLTAPYWSQVVRTHNHNEKEDVDVFVCLKDGDACGLAVIVAEPRELTIVNVVGSLSMEKLAQLEKHIGMQRLTVD